MEIGHQFKDDLDNLLDDIGMGKWQVLGLVTNFIMWAVLSSHTIGSAFWNPPLPFYCHQNFTVGRKIKDLDTVTPHLIVGDFNVSRYDSQCQMNDTTEKGFVHFVENFLGGFDTDIKIKSNIYIAGAASEPEESGYLADATVYYTGLQSCPFASYETDIFTSTVMTEWHLICEHSTFLPFFQSFYSFGMMIGCVLGGVIGDRFGRVETILFGSVIHGIGTVIVASVSNFPMVLFGRFIVGVTNRMITAAAVTWSLETCPMRYRGPVAMLIGIPYSIWLLFIALVGNYIRSWRPLYIAVSWPALLVVPVAWFMDESPRWLLNKGRRQEAAAVTWKAAKMNKSMLRSKEMIEAAFNSVIETSEAENKRRQENGRFRKIISSWNMVHILTSVAAVQVLIKLQYFALLFNANTFAGTNLYLYLALCGLLDIGAILSGIPLAGKIGRKPVSAGCMITSGLSLLGFLLVPSGLKWIQWTLLLGAFMLCSCAMQVMVVYTLELLPTTARARGLAVTYLCAHFGTLLAPFLPNNMAPLGWWVMETVIGVCSITSGLILLFLPETLHEPLCETINDIDLRAEEIEDRRRNPRRRRGFKTFVQLFYARKDGATEHILETNRNLSSITIENYGALFRKDDDTYNHDYTPYTPNTNQVNTAKNLPITMQSKEFY